MAGFTLITINKRLNTGHWRRNRTELIWVLYLIVMIQQPLSEQSIARNRYVRIRPEEMYEFPSVSLFMNFNPMMVPKSQLKKRLEDKMKKAEEELRIKFPGEMSELVLIKLRNIIASIDYTGNKKGLAVFVSPVFEEVYYLNMPMEDKTMVGNTFQIRDIVNYKATAQEFYVLLLKENESILFFDNGHSRIRIKSESHLNENTFFHAGLKSVFNDSIITGEMESVEKDYLSNVDQMLSQRLMSSPLPLFVMGSPEMVSEFRDKTIHNSAIVQYVLEVKNNPKYGDLIKTLGPLPGDWKLIREKYVRNRVKEAAKNKQLIRSVINVWNHVMEGNRGLLLIERDYLNDPSSWGFFGENYKFFGTFNKFSCVKNPLDKLIEKMLKNGGTVESVSRMVLKNAGPMAILEETI
ncbi:MAG: hypothetical protein J0H55_05310 [Chitinophagaceae bacterium]|mgnify:CR=1 FL=1|nr:hypothetical protein [Chitinophagaceae bacterium]